MEADLVALREAMGYTRRKSPRHPPVTATTAGRSTTDTVRNDNGSHPLGDPAASRQKRTKAKLESGGSFGTEYGTPQMTELLKCLICFRNCGGADRTRTRRRRL